MMELFYVLTVLVIIQVDTVTQIYLSIHLKIIVEIKSFKGVISQFEKMCIIVHNSVSLYLNTSGFLRNRV